MTNASVDDVLAAHLQTAGSAWSMGSFGVVAEFHREADETSQLKSTDALSYATSRGAIRLVSHQDAQPFAYETYRPKTETWSQGIALCLPESSACMGNHRTLSDLGEDSDAILPEHRSGRLFDLGVNALGDGCRQVDFCVRTRDEELIRLLEEHAGKNVFEHDNPVMPAILHAHPHRIAVTRLGRVEVFQKIGGPDTGDVSPEGPHTHLLPKLISADRTHDANIPIPSGLVPCAYLHPESSLVDKLGLSKAFDQNAYDAFQALLRLWGDPAFIQAKDAVFERLQHGEDVDDTAVSDSDRMTRAATKIALAQARQLDRRQVD